MKTVILAGGRGTRIGEESIYRPKPMVEINGRPILWHIMKRYDLYGYREFVICCGYKGHMIKEYFLHYQMSYSAIRMDLASRRTECDTAGIEDWDVTLANTGLDTLTAGRLLQIKKYIGEKEFFLTYGDGVGDVNMDELLKCHRQSKKAITVTITKPEGRFGAVRVNEGTGEITGFKEKARRDQNYVNAGFMVCSPAVFDYLGDGSEMLEATPFEQLAVEHQMNAYVHKGFWSPMDNIKDKEYLEQQSKGNGPVWLSRKVGQ